MEPRVSLNEVLITERLYVDAVPVPNQDTVQDTLERIAGNMNKGVGGVFQTAVDRALELTSGSTAGLSILDRRAGGDAMVWVAVSGINANLLHGEVPRHDSPCGYTLEQRQPHLFADPARHYTLMPEFRPRVSELLAVPAFDRQGGAFGTLWVFVQDKKVALDREDLAQLEALVEYMMLARDVQQRLGTA